ncbi:hypothetical protein PTKIN_Ptkin06aG0147100 [Pterospermum kingtungense]
MIIHLQALLGNKWAAIASYLPQRTDNDIKNYWNTHLKKKLKKFQLALDPHTAQDPSASQFVSRNLNERRSLDFATTSAASSTTPRLNQTSSSYASSTENISRLLEGWMRSSSEKTNSDMNSPLMLVAQEKWSHQNNSFDNNDSMGSTSVATTCLQGGYRSKTEQESGTDLISHEEFVSILSFENMNNVEWDKSTCDSTSKDNCQDSAKDHHDDKINVTMIPQKKQKAAQNNNNNNINNPPLSFLEKWLLDESSGQVEEMNQMMELSSIF